MAARSYGKLKSLTKWNHLATAAFLDVRLSRVSTYRTAWNHLASAAFINARLSRVSTYRTAWNHLATAAFRNARLSRASLFQRTQRLETGASTTAIRTYELPNVHKVPLSNEKRTTSFWQISFIYMISVQFVHWRPPRSLSLSLTTNETFMSSLLILLNFRNPFKQKPARNADAASPKQTPHRKDEQSHRSRTFPICVLSDIDSFADVRTYAFVA